VQLDAPALALVTGVAEAAAGVRRSFDAAGIDRTPAFHLWVNTLRQLVLREAHKAIPRGHATDHLHDLHRFAVAASLVAGRPYAGAVRASASGRVHLPGAGLVLDLGPCAVGRWVKLETDGRAVKGTLGHAEFVADPRATPVRWRGGPGWASLQQVGWGVWFDLDEDLLCSRMTGAVHPPLDAALFADWARLLKGAGRLLAEVEDRLSVPVRVLVRSIVPGDAPPGRTRSWTLMEAFGAVHVSRTISVAMMAETLVHEAGHAQLNLLLDYRRLWQLGHTLARFRSPWRTDLRRIQGMLHGLWAFHAVGEFWTLLLREGRTGEFDRLARRRLREVSLQLADAADEIAGAHELNNAGEELVRDFRRQQERLAEATALFPPPPEDAEEIRHRMRRHRESAAPAPARPAAAAPPRRDVRWSEALGVSMPPAINRLADGVFRCEAVSERVMRAVVRSDPVVASWAALAAESEETERQSALLVAGSIAYASGDFGQAARCFWGYVQERVEDVDAWGLLAAALRRAGRFAEADAVVFRLPDLLRRAGGRRPELGWLQEYS
jgi:HEXXH motif-containing protein